MIGDILISDFLELSEKERQEYIDKFLDANFDNYITDLINRIAIIVVKRRMNND